MAVGGGSSTSASSTMAAEQHRKRARSPSPFNGAGAALSTPRTEEEGGGGGRRASASTPRRLSLSPKCTNLPADSPRTTGGNNKRNGNSKLPILAERRRGAEPTGTAIHGGPTRTALCSGSTAAIFPSERTPSTLDTLNSLFAQTLHLLEQGNLEIARQLLDQALLSSSLRDTGFANEQTEVTARRHELRSLHAAVSIATGDPLLAFVLLAKDGVGSMIPDAAGAGSSERCRSAGAGGQDAGAPSSSSAVLRSTEGGPEILADVDGGGPEGGPEQTYSTVVSGAGDGPGRRSPRSSSAGRRPPYAGSDAPPYGKSTSILDLPGDPERARASSSPAGEERRVEQETAGVAEDQNPALEDRILSSSLSDAKRLLQLVSLGGRAGVLGKRALQTQIFVGHQHGPVRMVDVLFEEDLLRARSVLVDNGGIADKLLSNILRKRVAPFTKGLLSDDWVDEALASAVFWDVLSEIPKIHQKMMLTRQSTQPQSKDPSTDNPSPQPQSLFDSRGVESPSLLDVLNVTDVVNVVEWLFQIVASSSSPPPPEEEVEEQLPPNKIPGLGEKLADYLDFAGNELFAFPEGKTFQPILFGDGVVSLSVYRAVSLLRAVAETKIDFYLKAVSAPDDTTSRGLEEVLSAPDDTTSPLRPGRRDGGRGRGGEDGRRNCILRAVSLQLARGLDLDRRGAGSTMSPTSAKFSLELVAKLYDSFSGRLVWDHWWHRRTAVECY